MKFWARSDRGIVREINEDSYNMIAGYPGVPISFIIADGMGGHNSGEIASKMAVDIISNHVLQLPGLLAKEENITAIIEQMMMKANAEVYLVSQEQESTHGMGTTLIITIVYNRKIYVGHIGDSRVYLLRDGQLQRMTTDHSFIEELVRNGSLTREEAEKHPSKNILTRALGCSETIQVDVFSVDMKENDVYLMCTDGLTNTLDENEIKEIIENNKDLEFACNELIRRANEKGGEDNITVILFDNDGI